MKIGFFSPLPPAQTGVADYAEALLGGLRKHGEVAVDAPYTDVALYHVGNNQLHRAIYERALTRPGVVVLHDAVLQHLFLGMFDETNYVNEFVFNYGEWMRGFAEELWRHRARSAAGPRYFDYPMLKRIATASRAVIVHNPAAARVVKRHAPEALVAEIPHLFVPPALPSGIDTIAHLQSNKARPAAELFQTIQTVDSEKLARRLDQAGRPLEVMIEVKLSEEETKAGAAPEALPALIEAIRACPNLHLTGLMTMPPWSDDPEVTRPYFRRLAELGREHRLPKLSMGMSHDLEAAIEEGATHIRIGTALFGPRPKDG